MYGEVLAKPLQVVVNGAWRPGLLGGKGSPQPAVGAEVTFSVDRPETGSVFVTDGQPVGPVLTTITDTAGRASAHLKLGENAGEVMVTASVETADGVQLVSFTALAGIKVIGKELEAGTRGTIEEIGLLLRDPTGEPVEGITVCFEVEGNGHGASVGGKERRYVVTDADGRATTSWRLGKEIGQYFVRAQIQDDRQTPERFSPRIITFEAMAISKPKMVMELLGGLAIFILGMKWMSGGLRRVADRRLKAILQAMTRNRLVATAVGTGLTAVIQSSSATTVMVVGFVNAGLLTLSQAIAVDYGACIGTTVTAQIIAFKLNQLAFPAIALGLVMSSLTKRPGVKSVGEAILGFGILFLGLTLMSDVLKPLRHSPGFLAWFQMFQCTPTAGGGIPAGPALMCIVIGTVTTMIVQSSSATIGLVLVLGSQGLLDFYTALPLVLGDNIGTTITAVLASLPANRNAKRTAASHCLFKIFGAVYMYILLFVPAGNGEPIFLAFVNWFTPGDVFAENPQNLARHIANAHTAFNVLNVALFLPFIGVMVRLCQRIIPLTDADQERVLVYLEPNLLASPSLALQQAAREVAYMVRRAQKSINDGCTYFFEGGRELEQKIGAREEVIDRLQHEITGYLVELSQKNLSPSEADLIPALIHAVNDAERIGDHSELLVELGHLRREQKHAISETALDEVRELQSTLNEQFDATYRSLVEGDATQVGRVLAQERMITDQILRSSEAHTLRLEHGECDVQAGVIFLDLMAHLERVGDHLTNIAERAGKLIQVMKA